MEWKLFYDGGCNLCHISKLKAEKWAEKARQPLKVDILQSDEAIEKGYWEKGAMVLEADGKVYYAAEAWLRLMDIAPWYLQPIKWLKYTPPTRWLLIAGYNMIAKFRYRIFGTRACKIPTAPTNSKQLASLQQK